MIENQPADSTQGRTEMMDNQSMERQTLQECVVQRFIDAIMSGRMQPGQRLASEVQLAADFQISRNILREAMKTLEVLSIIEIYHGKGTYVSQYAKERIVNIDFVRILACNQTVSELLETRIVIEPGRAEFAAQRRTAEDIEMMWADVGNRMQNYDDDRRNNSAFHLIVARASHCSVLPQYLETVFKRLQYSDYGDFTSQLTDRSIQNEIKEHQKIIECIIDRDGKGAKNLMYQHLVNRYNLIQSFNNGK